MGFFQGARPELEGRLRIRNERRGDVLPVRVTTTTVHAQQETGDKVERVLCAFFAKRRVNGLDVCHHGLELFCVLVVPIRSDDLRHEVVRVPVCGGGEKANGGIDVLMPVGAKIRSDKQKKS